MVQKSQNESRNKSSTFGTASVFVLACILYVFAFSATELHSAWQTEDLIYVALRIIPACIVVFLWRPLLLKKNRTLAFLVAALATIVVFGALDELMDLLIFPPGSERYSFDIDGLSWAVVNTWTAVITILVLVLFVDRLEENRRLADLEKLEKTAQLAALHQQLNPHILLNGLNNIYALASSKSDLTADAVLELSDVLRYALYETEERAVPLSREIELLHNYIAMQKLGLENRIDVKFDVLGDPNKRCVAPLVFLPIVENAFKHGANTDLNEPAHLLFRLIVDDDRISFVASNPFQPPKGSPTVRGVGLENVKARLKLSYGDRHHLRIAQNSGRFTVNLTLDGEPS